jgi:ABC-type uncharacterized transport system auxiliary subunit
MKSIIAAMAILVLCGCEKSRNDVKSQAEDYAICTKAGMRSYPNTYGEILCAPPAEVKP